MLIDVVTGGPSEALVISGVFHSGKSTVIVGGRAFVMPCIQMVQRIPLNVMTIVVDSKHVYTAQGVAISVTGIAQIRVNAGSDDMIRTAVELFGNKGSAEIAHVALETLEGHQRAIIGKLTVEQIYRDRNTFSQQVHSATTADMFNMGIVVVSYTIKDISDDVGYLMALGVTRTAEVQRDARIGQAIATMEATIGAARAEALCIESKLANDTEIARAKRDFEIQKAACDVQVNTASAEADMAYSLQAAILKQRIAEQAYEVKVVERRQEIEVQDQEMKRREQELDSSVRKPAEAEKYRMEQLAKANRERLVIEAEAAAEAITLQGEAEAFVIETKAIAEADQMVKKAEAWEEYKNAAIVEMVLASIPKVAAEVSSQLSQVNRVTMVSDGTGLIGPAKMTQEVITIMNSLPEVVKRMTGISLIDTTIRLSS